MTEPTVKLSEADWQRVIQILATAPWQQVNGLIMNIGGQLGAQQQAAAPKPNGEDLAPGDFRQ
jgi:hypothetical protein